MPWRSLPSLEQFVRPLAVALVIAGATVAGLTGASGAPAAHAVARATAATPAPAAVPMAIQHKQAIRHRQPTQHASRSHRRPPRTAHRAAHAHRTAHRTGWVRPARGPVTSGYGRRWGSFHPGVDIGARYGSTVHAITGGRVVSAGWIPGYGKVVRVRAHGKVFYYPHLSGIRVRHGHVRTDQVLGRVGSTGYSTGPHLHVEIRIHGRSVNPRRILVRHGVHLGVRR